MPPPIKRPRAPTITVDPSAVSDQPSNGHSPSAHPNMTCANRFLEPEIQSAYSGDPKNSLLVPNSRPRGDSVHSHSSVSTTGSNTIVDSLTHPSDRSQTPVPDEEVFKPDSENEIALFKTEGSPFGVAPGHLGKLIPRKSIQALYLLHGLPGLSKALRTDLREGLDATEDKISGTVSFKDVQDTPMDTAELGDTPTKNIKRSDTRSTQGASSSTPKFTDRKRIFGDNRLPEKSTKSFLQLAWIAVQDKILIVLIIAAIISLAVGIYSSVTKKKGEGAKIDWVEGVTILIAVLVVVTAGALVDWKKEKQFAALNKQKEDRVVKVIRSGKTRLVSVYDIFPGDIMHLEPGDMVPVDGVYIQGSGVTCDESAATGESDLIRKVPAGDVLNAYQNGRDTRKLDPFIIAGSQVNEGLGTFLVTAVGIRSSYGKTFMSLQEDNPPTPLQERLDKLAGW
jgi:P-type Ca2+ transporter type 2C